LARVKNEEEEGPKKRVEIQEQGGSHEHYNKFYRMKKLSKIIR
jgi:hypothetical protein